MTGDALGPITLILAPAGGQFELRAGSKEQGPMGWLVWLRQQRPPSLSPTPSAHPPCAAKCRAVAAPKGSLSSHLECIQVRAARPSTPSTLSLLHPAALGCAGRVPGGEPLCWLSPRPENPPLQTPHGFCSAVPSPERLPCPLWGTSAAKHSVICLVTTLCLSCYNARSLRVGFLSVLSTAVSPGTEPAINRSPINA